jgi:phenylacetate-CoA ligase
VAAAEPIFDFQRALVEQAFGAPVRERYGCNEHALLAQECAQGGMHVATDRVHLEIVREDGTHTGPGEIGSVLVTDLDSRRMPLVRYRLGDLAAWRASACPCGRPYPLLERVHGRVRDALRSATGALYSPHHVAAALVGRPVRAFQLVSGADRRLLEVRLVGERCETSDLVERWRTLAGGPVAVRFVSDLIRSPNGKILPVVDAEAAVGVPA